MEELGMFSGGMGSLFGSANGGPSTPSPSYMGTMGGSDTLGSGMGGGLGSLFGGMGGGGQPSYQQLIQQLMGGGMGNLLGGIMGNQQKPQTPTTQATAMNNQTMQLPGQQNWLQNYQSQQSAYQNLNNINSQQNSNEQNLQKQISQQQNGIDKSVGTVLGDVGTIAGMAAMFL